MLILLPLHLLLCSAPSEKTTTKQHIFYPTFSSWLLNQFSGTTEVKHYVDLELILK
jgi:hypothetical protein